MSRIEHKGNAKATNLTADLGGTTTDLTIPGTDFTGYPDGTIGTFYITIDRDLPTQEKILCATRTGNVITAATGGRGADGTPIQFHGTNAVIEHVWTAIEADEANAHIESPALHVTSVTSTTRPPVPATNQMILETDTLLLLSYIGGGWQPVSSGARNGVFYENSTTVTANYTITAGMNAGSFGPITINSGVVVTVPAGSTWTVVG